MTRHCSLSARFRSQLYDNSRIGRGGDRASTNGRSVGLSRRQGRGGAVVGVAIDGARAQKRALGARTASAVSIESVASATSRTTFSGQNRVRVCSGAYNTGASRWRVAPVTFFPWLAGAIGVVAGHRGASGGAVVKIFFDPIEKY